MKLYDLDIYYLVNQLYYKMNKDDIDIKNLLERNACKFEYWFLYWYFLRNKSVTEINFNESIFL